MYRDIYKRLYLLMYLLGDVSSNQSTILTTYPIYGIPSCSSSDMAKDEMYLLMSAERCSDVSRRDMIDVVRRRQKEESSKAPLDH